MIRNSTKAGIRPPSIPTNRKEAIMAKGKPKPKMGGKGKGKGKNC